MDTIWNIINTITAVITIARIIVVVTPTKKDDVALGKIEAVIMPVIKALQLGFGNAKR
mgnify:FL=1|tara:strand:- start:82 stop:255 length:174 start_codon:yes stop_codon:yes gene_type:complete